MRFIRISLVSQQRFLPPFQILQTLAQTHSDRDYLLEPFAIPIGLKNGIVFFLNPNTMEFNWTLGHLDIRAILSASINTRILDCVRNTSVKEFLNCASLKQYKLYAIIIKNN